MAFVQTTGLVQRLYVDAGGTATAACVFIGPTPANIELFTLTREATDAPHTGAFKSSILDGLAQALASRREVVVGHEESDGIIGSLELR
jgi:hypothetical protein